MMARLGHRRRTIAAGALMGVALLLAGRLILDPPKPGVSINAALEVAQVPALTQKKPKHDDALLDPTLQTQQLELSENRSYEGAGRNIFQYEDTSHRMRVVVPPRPTPPAPTPEHVVPTIALRFFGFGLMPNQPRKAFLVEGDSVFLANEGDIVDRRYRVLKIDSNAVVVEDLIEKSLHTLSLPG